MRKAKKFIFKSETHSKSQLQEYLFMIEWIQKNPFLFFEFIKK